MSSTKIEESFKSESGTDGETSIVDLPPVEVPNNEDNGEELVKLRGKLYRFDDRAREWKERGIGDIKLLLHKDQRVRIVMRREVTLTVCANHFVTPDIKMNIHCGSDRAFTWTVFADFADDTINRQAILAIRFPSKQDAQLWQTKFLEAQDIVRTKYRDEVTSHEGDEVSSLNRSEDTDTPEPQSDESANSTNEDTQESIKVVIQLKDLKVNIGNIE